jgi:hypothetical protein
MATCPPSNNSNAVPAHPQATITPHQHLVGRTTAWSAVFTNLSLPVTTQTATHSCRAHIYCLHPPSKLYAPPSLSKSPFLQTVGAPPPFCLITLSQHHPPPYLQLLCFSNNPPYLTPYRTETTNTSLSLDPSQSTHKRTNGTVQCPKVDAACLCAQAHWAAL